VREHVGPRASALGRAVLEGHNFLHELLVLAAGQALVALTQSCKGALGTA
jgi:hypothetical protein